MSKNAVRAGSTTPASPPKENLYRINPDIQLERSSKDAMPVMRGHFAVWDTWTEIRSAYEGHFMERFAPGAMTKTLGEHTPKVLFQHGKDPQIGDKVLGPVQRVEPDPTGAYYEVQLLDTSYNRDLLPGLEAGLYGASFRFSVMQEDVVSRPKRSEHNPHGLPERTVTEAKVMEFGPVTFPAYPAATAGVRSITDEILRMHLGLSDEEIAERARRVVKEAPVRVFFNGKQIAGRADTEAVDLLQQMVDLGTQFIGMEADDPDDKADQDAMNAIIASINALIQEEQAEPDDDNATDSEGSAPELKDNRSEERAVWTTAYIDNLPDSAFLHVEAGGKKDSEGKTTPRSLRHFPYKDFSGKVDLPHLRNALARIPQSNLPQSVKDAATAKAKRLLASADGRAMTPEPHEATTFTEPEPSGVTTRSDSTNLFWFVKHPKK